MTLRPGSTPTAVSRDWRDVIYKGRRQLLPRGHDRPRTADARCQRRHAPAARRPTSTGPPRCTANTGPHRRRPTTAAAVRSTSPERRSSTTARRRGPVRITTSTANRCRSAADSLLRPVLQRNDRRGPDLQRDAVGSADPERHGDAGGRVARRHPVAHRAHEPGRDRGEREPDQPLLDRLQRQRRGDGLPGRALPGRGLLELRSDRHPRRDELLRHRRSAPRRATATASARPTPRAT